MAEEPIIAPREDEPNPFAPPQSDLNDRWGMGDPEAEALRRAHVQDESYAKALTIANFAYAFFFGVTTAYFEWILISHLRGSVSAPWIVRPGYVAMQFMGCGVPIFALCAAWGFFRRARWALRFEFLMALCWFGIWALDPLVRSTPQPMMEFIGQTVMYLAIASPMLNVWDLRGSVIFDPGYTHAVKATPYINVWPKLSLELTLIAVVLFVLSAVLLILSMAS